MWIRSQNKEVLLPMGLGGFYPVQNGVYVTAINVNDVEHYETIGTYESKKRALEVLENIQESIERTLINAENAYEIPWVYEMPQE